MSTVVQSGISIAVATVAAAGKARAITVEEIFGGADAPEGAAVGQQAREFMSEQLGGAWDLSGVMQNTTLTSSCVDSNGTMTVAGPGATDDNPMAASKLPFAVATDGETGAAVLFAVETPGETNATLTCEGIENAEEGLYFHAVGSWALSEAQEALSACMDFDYTDMSPAGRTVQAEAGMPATCVQLTGDDSFYMAGNDDDLFSGVVEDLADAELPADSLVGDEAAQIVNQALEGSWLLNSSDSATITACVGLKGAITMFAGGAIGGGGGADDWFPIGNDTMGEGTEQPASASGMQLDAGKTTKTPVALRSDADAAGTHLVLFAVVGTDFSFSLSCEGVVVGSDEQSVQFHALDTWGFDDAAEAGPACLGRSFDELFADTVTLTGHRSEEAAAACDVAMADDHDDDRLGDDDAYSGRVWSSNADVFNGYFPDGFTFSGGYSGAMCGFDGSEYFNLDGYARTTVSSYDSWVPVGANGEHLLAVYSVEEEASPGNMQLVYMCMLWASDGAGGFAISAPYYLSFASMPDAQAGCLYYATAAIEFGTTAPFGAISPNSTVDCQAVLDATTAQDDYYIDCQAVIYAATAVDDYHYMYTDGFEAPEEDTGAAELVSMLLENVTVPAGVVVGVEAGTIWGQLFGGSWLVSNIDGLGTATACAYSDTGVVTVLSEVAPAADDHHHRDATDDFASADGSDDVFLSDVLDTLSGGDLPADTLIGQRAEHALGAELQGAWQSPVANSTDSVTGCFDTNNIVLYTTRAESMRRRRRLMPGSGPSLDTKSAVAMRSDSEQSGRHLVLFVVLTSDFTYVLSCEGVEIGSSGAKVSFTVFGQQQMSAAGTAGAACMSRDFDELQVTTPSLSLERSSAAEVTCQPTPSDDGDDDDLLGDTKDTDHSMGDSTDDSMAAPLGNGTLVATVQTPIGVKQSADGSKAIVLMLIEGPGGGEPLLGCSGLEIDASGARYFHQFAGGRLGKAAMVLDFCLGPGFEDLTAENRDQAVTSIEDGGLCAALVSDDADDAGDGTDVDTSADDKTEPLADPCVPNPCRNGATCVSGKGADFTCECETDPFTGDRCQTVVVQGPCADEPCRDGVCLDTDDAAASTGYECICDAGWLHDAAGSCTKEIPEEAEPTCFDGQLNGQETGLDCGYELDGECGLCAQGFGCESAENCQGELVCSEARGTCSPAIKPKGAYVEMAALKIHGVTPNQFLDTLADSYKAKLVERTGAIEAIINEVMEVGSPAVTGRRMQAVSAAPVIEVDTTLRFSETVDVAAAQAIVTAYVQSNSTRGGNGLLEDLQAAAPALASRLTVDSSAMEIQTAVQTKDVVVAQAVGTGSNEPAEDDKGNESIVPLVGSVVGAFIVLCVCGRVGYLVCKRSTAKAAGSRDPKPAVQAGSGSDMTKPVQQGATFSDSNPMQACV